MPTIAPQISRREAYDLRRDTSNIRYEGQSALARLRRVVDKADLGSAGADAIKELAEALAAVENLEKTIGAAMQPEASVADAASKLDAALSDHAGAKALDFEGASAFYGARPDGTIGDTIRVSFGAIWYATKEMEDIVGEVRKSIPELNDIAIMAVSTNPLESFGGITNGYFPPGGGAAAAPSQDFSALE